MDGATIVLGVHSREVTDSGSFAEVADDRAIEAEYSNAGRRLSAELAKRYADHIADDEDDDSLLDARLTVAGLGKMEAAGDAVDMEADKLTVKWFDEHRVAIKDLSDERQADYDAIKGMSPQPQRIDLKRPRIRTEDTEDLDGNLLETRGQHLMADENGRFPVALLNDWEMQVVDQEMRHKGFLAWYRNPSRPSADALAVAWRDDNGNWRRMCPDFIFFHGDEAHVQSSIVDPHGIHLSDALNKLKGLAAVADSYGDSFHRIEAVAKIDERLRVLDLKHEGVREAVNTAQNAESVYRGNAAANC